jgi:hypothetical protein
MDRRAFLKRAGLATLLASLGGCQVPGIPGTRPRPTPRYRHIAASSPTPTDTPNPIATATPTPETTATPTETPTPGETSQPTPTESELAASSPFPPGPPTKLGLCVTRFEGQILELVQIGQMPLIKTLEHDVGFMKGIKAASPHTRIVGRITLDQINLDSDPTPLARQFVDGLMPLAGDPGRMETYEAWEAYNEPVVDTPDKMKRLADFEAERVRLLAERGVKSVIGNFAAGHPPLELWEHFKPALQAIQQHGGYLGLHEYSAPVMQFAYGEYQLQVGVNEGDEGWLTMRYRKSYRHHLIPMGFKVPLLITECGIDGTIKPRPGPEGTGWQDFVKYWKDKQHLGDSGPKIYVDQLAWYDDQLQKDDYVLGAAIFVAGASEKWQTYEILGDVGEVLKLYLAVHRPGQS